MLMWKRLETTGDILSIFDVYLQNANKMDGDEAVSVENKKDLKIYLNSKRANTYDGDEGDEVVFKSQIGNWKTNPFPKRQQA